MMSAFFTRSDTAPTPENQDIACVDSKDNTPFVPYSAVAIGYTAEGGQGCWGLWTRSYSDWCIFSNTVGAAYQVGFLLYIGTPNGWEAHATNPSGTTFRLGWIKNGFGLTTTYMLQIWGYPL